MNEELQRAFEEMQAAHATELTTLQNSLKETTEQMTTMGVELKLIKEASATQSLPFAQRKERFYKNRDMDTQGFALKRIIDKNPNIRTLKNEEKFNEFCKWMIDVADYFRGIKHQNPSLCESIQEHNARIMKDTKARAAYAEGADATGGVLVPVEYQWDMIMLHAEETFALQNCTVLTMGSSSLKLPKELTRATVTWEDEAAELDENEGTYDNITLTAKKLTAFAIASQEVLDDSEIDIVSILASQMSYSMLHELDNQVLNGASGDPFTSSVDGSNNVGVLLSAGATVTMSAGKTSFTDIQANDLLDMQYGIPKAHRKNGKYVFNDDITKYVRKLKDDNGNYLMDRMTESASPTIWGKQYFESIEAPDVANDDAVSTAFGVYGDFRYFYIGRRAGVMRLEVDPYGKFRNNQIQYRMITRWSAEVAKTDAFCNIKTPAA